MLEFLKKCLKIGKLFLLYWRRIIFVRNKYKVSFFTKLRANIFGGYLADQYILYDFKHNDKKQYLSEFDWYRSRYINEPFDFLMNNKIACTEILKQYVNTPKIFALRHKDIVSNMGEGLLSYDDVMSILEKENNLFMKPYGAGKGTGVYRFAYEDNKYYIDEKPVDRESIIKHLKENKKWILCETVNQHDYANRLYDKTFNTIRLITLRDIHTNEFKIFFAVQRIGTKETIPVDNGSRGGLVSKIDLDTGELSEARCLHNLNVFKKHPDSNNPIEGVIIPNWENIKKEMLELTNKLPYMYFIAWDIIITPDGISVIEANTSSGVNIIQLWGGQRYGELGDFYRHHRAIK
jgi:hypothetical protein